MRPLGITIGDASGVGPEIALRSWLQKELKHPFVLYGDLTALEYYADRLGMPVQLHRISCPGDRLPGVLNVIDGGLLAREEITPGALSGSAGTS
jgi:4-hydroxythreonine-4-phosphate dehydrogenase